MLFTPASNIVTPPPSSSIRYTFIDRGTPPRTRQTPSATGSAVGARELARRARAGVERALQLLFRARPRRREHPDLACEAHAVGERVVADDQAVAHGQQVEAGHPHGTAGRRDALERRLARERARRVPAHGRAVALRDDRLDLERPVRHGREQLAEERPHALGSVGLGLADQPVDAVRRPARGGAVEVAPCERVEVALRHLPGVRGHVRTLASRRCASRPGRTETGPRRARDARGLAAAAAAALDRGAALQRVGARGRRRDRARRLRDGHARLARRPRARARPGRVRARGRAPARLHARPPRPLRAGGVRAGPVRLRAVAAPAPRAPDRGARRPRRGARAADRDRAPERRARGAARALGRGAQGAVERHERAARRRARPAARRRRRDRRRTVAGARDARPRAVPRRAAPARAPAADLRRPRARPHLALLRPRLDARPRAGVPRLARRRRRARRAADAVRPRPPVHRPARPRRRATGRWCGSGSTPCWARSASAARRPRSTCCRASTATS